MTRETIIELLKEYKQNKARLKIKQKELNQKKLFIENYEGKETKLISSYEQNGEIHSNNQISDKVLQIVEENEEKRIKTQKEIDEIEKIIQELKEKVETVEDRLIGLKYKERELLVAYYIDGRTAENISRTLYYEMYERICTPRYIQKIIEKATNNMINI